MAEAGTSPGPDCLVITGATATGKTAVAVQVARMLDGEVISVDSRQVYRGMDIGTAKPTVAERCGVPHHGFDLVDPSARFNAGRFAALARQWMAEIRGRGRVPILTGGTGFFLKALTDPLFEEPVLDTDLRERWKAYLRDVPPEALARWAALLDPAAAARAPDRQRLARIVEITTLTGQRLSWWHAHAPSATPPVVPLVAVLELPRDMLYARIEARVDSMMEAGLVDEVRELLGRGYSERDPGLNATGYIEVIPALRGEYDLAEAVVRIKAATRQYARRQLTWLRHQLPPGTSRLDARRDAGGLATDIVALWREADG
ncbi:MAG TPA: tRNA (adenosine(37)-N6)-dimethylallyltransferase MiaA [Longimicrobiales bacterium]|nr:tRNA (adenosine(37)-N6)-dimethylallyltransferase MiaA [Longimicrobiales bacterium]